MFVFDYMFQFYDGFKVDEILVKWKKFFNFVFFLYYKKYVGLDIFLNNVMCYFILYKWCFRCCKLGFCRGSFLWERDGLVLIRVYIDGRSIIDVVLQLNIVEGKMQYLFDESGWCYLDVFVGIVIVFVGYGYFIVVDVVVKQIKLLQYIIIIYFYYVIVNYVEVFVQCMFGNFKV